MTSHELLEPKLNRARAIALVLGGIALALCAAGAMANPTQFYRSYLFGYLYWISVALGCLAIVMLHHLVGGGWGFVIRRLLESGSRTILLLAILFVPLILGMSRLYSWTQPHVHAEESSFAKVYLNPTFFLARVAIYFGVWLLLSFFLNKWSAQQDRTGDPAMLRKMGALSGPGILIYALTVTFAAVDWVLSLEPHWFSTIYGLLFIIIQALAAMSFVVVVVMLLSDTVQLYHSPGQLNDLGSLLFTLVMLWAYMSFAQYLIIWSGNLQEEIPWYAKRTAGGWAYLAVTLMVFHFAVPFTLLLLRSVKRRVKVLAAVASLLLVMSVADLYWLVVPAFGQSGPRPHWMDITAIAGIGGLWIAAFLSQLKRQPLLPLHDPRFEGVLANAE
ncbi:MAG: hypothetical protein HYX72_08145 [Acidobacteria bacterium]|nr:hypothetical protein [Acidobacteriota bacterium]